MRVAHGQPPDVGLTHAASNLAVSNLLSVGSDPYWVFGWVSVASRLRHLTEQLRRAWWPWWVAVLVHLDPRI